MRGLAIGLAVTVFAAPVCAQEMIHTERVAVLLSRERIVRDAERVRTSIARSTDARTPPAQRVHLARERAHIEAALEHDLHLGRSVGLAVEHGAQAQWTRSTGTPWRAIDGAQRFRDCAALARAEHVISDDARDCVARGSEGTPAVGALPWPLYVPGYRAEFAEDRDGARSAAIYRRVERELAQSATRDLRIALAGMQIVARDHDRALATLSPLGTEYEVLLARALADWGAGRHARAETALVALMRASPDRPEAPFDLAQLLLGVAPYEFQRPPLATARRALAGYRLQICNAARGMSAPANISEVAARQADRLQFMIERPPNWSGDGAVRPPVAGFPPNIPNPTASRAPPLMDCARARSRAMEVFGPERAVPARAATALRTVQPPTAALVGPRPSFAWTGAQAATIEMCADRACTNVRATLQAASSPHRPPRALPEGRWFWRVRAGAQTSPTRVLWIASGTRAPTRISDVDCDGWPDVPLGESGWYARFGADGNPRLTALPGDESATASTFFAGDLDGDGCGDFAQIAGYGLFALYGSPSGPEAPRPLEAGDAWWADAVGDVDGDGLEDLLLNTNGALELWSHGRRQPVTFDGRGVRAIGDVDGDGFADLATVSFNSMEQRGSWSLVRGSARGLASDGVTPLPITSDSQRLFEAGDVDGDFRIDVLLLHVDRRVRDGPGHFALHRGTARGFDPRPHGRAVAVSDPYVPAHAGGDLDGDGFDDVLFVDRNEVRLHRGSRAGLAATATRLGSWPSDADLYAARIPNARPSVLWLFPSLATTALRVVRGNASEVRLAPP